MTTRSLAGALLNTLSAALETICCSQRRRTPQDHRRHWRVDRRQHVYSATSVTNGSSMTLTVSNTATWTFTERRLRISVDVSSARRRYLWRHRRPDRLRSITTAQLLGGFGDAGRRQAARVCLWSPAAAAMSVFSARPTDTISFIESHDVDIFGGAGDIVNLSEAATSQSPVGSAVRPPPAARAWRSRPPISRHRHLRHGVKPVGWSTRRTWTFSAS